MGLPARKLEPPPDSSSRFSREVAEEPHEAVFRPIRKPDGELVIEELPLTLDVLLDPRIEDEMSQSRPHERQLGPMADTLERFLERQEGVAVLSDMIVLWEHMGERNVVPDLCVVKGVRDRDAIDESFDPVAEGTGPCLVFEVVSDSTKDVKAKDEKENPPLYERMGVEDLVLVYPRRPAKKASQKLRLDVKRLDATGSYRANRPRTDGWILLRSVGLRIKSAEDGIRLLVQDVRTGERLLTSVEEEAARRAAEVRAEQAEARARQEVEARMAAEAKVQELSAKIRRLESSGD